MPHIRNVLIYFMAGAFHADHRRQVSFLRPQGGGEHRPQDRLQAHFRQEPTPASGRSCSSGRRTSPSSARPRSPPSASSTASSTTATRWSTAPRPIPSSCTWPGACADLKALPLSTLADLKRELAAGSVLDNAASADLLPVPLRARRLDRPRPPGGAAISRSQGQSARLGRRPSCAASRPTRWRCSRTSAPASPAGSAIRAARTRARSRRSRRWSAAGGSCRDFAVLFVEAARSLGFGARIVVGLSLQSRARARGRHHPCLGRGLRARRGLDHLRSDQPRRRRLQPDPRRRRTRSIGQAMPVAGSFTGMTDAFRGMSVEVVVGLLKGDTRHDRQDDRSRQAPRNGGPEGTDLRRLLSEVEANEKILRQRQDELEAHLLAAPPPPGRRRPRRRATSSGSMPRRSPPRIRGAASSLPPCWKELSSGLRVPDAGLASAGLVARRRARQTPRLLKTRGRTTCRRPPPRPSRRLIPSVPRAC